MGVLFTVLLDKYDSYTQVRLARFVLEAGVNWPDALN